uniref:Uncharacterized protein n=1 Tax=Arundo donax TaxID=35708 RepID=A0A0A9AXL5_ARUDO
MVSKTFGGMSLTQVRLWLGSV